MSIPAHPRVLIAYDIHRPARAARARQALRAYTSNAQKSVFDASLTLAQQKTLFRELAKLEHDDDDWLFVLLDPRAKVTRFGRSQADTKRSDDFFYWG